MRHASVSDADTPTATADPEVRKHLDRAREARRRDRPGLAGEEYRAVLELDPANAEATGALAGLFATATPDVPWQERLLTEAERAYRESRLDAVEGNARRAIEVAGEGPGAEWARELLGLVASERFAEAARASDEFAANVRSLYEEGMVLLRAGKGNDACRKLRQCRSLAPRDSQVAKAEERACELAAAERVPGSSSADLRRQALSRERAGDWVEAEAAWGELARRDPGSREYSVRFAASRSLSARRAAIPVRIRGDLAERPATVRRATPKDRGALRRGPSGGEASVTPTARLAPPVAPSRSADPAEVEKHYRGGLAHYQAGRYAEAEREFDSVLFLDPRHAAALEGKKRCQTLRAR